MRQNIEKTVVTRDLEEFTFMAKIVLRLRILRLMAKIFQLLGLTDKCFVRFKANG